MVGKYFHTHKGSFPREYVASLNCFCALSVFKGIRYVTPEAFMAIHVQSRWNKINTHLLNVQLCTWDRSCSGCCCAVVWISLPNKHAATGGAWIHLANLQEQKTISFEQHLLGNNYITVSCYNWRSATFLSSLLIIQSSVAFFLSLIWKVWSTCAGVARSKFKGATPWSIPDALWAHANCTL